MQRTIVLFGLSLVLLATGFTESEACWRGRRCCQPMCPPPMYYFCPPPVVYYEVTPAKRTLVELPPYRSSSGRTYRAFDTLEAETDEHDKPRRSTTGAPAGPDIFLGQARAVAKTSISDGP